MIETCLSDSDCLCENTWLKFGVLPSSSFETSDTSSLIFLKTEYKVIQNGYLAHGGASRNDAERGVGVSGGGGASAAAGVLSRLHAPLLLLQRPSAEPAAFWPHLLPVQRARGT